MLSWLSRHYEEDNLDENEIETLATEPLKRKNFNFADMIRDRTYPEIKVSVYVDEAKALRLLEISEEEAVLDTKIARRKDAIAGPEQIEQLEALDAERWEIVESMQDTKYVAVVRGFTPERRNEMLAEAFEKYPVEYEETTHPITQTPVTTEIEQPERAKFFQDLLWQQAIVKFVAPDGAVADPMSVEEIHALRVQFPHATRAALDIAVEKVQMASDWYRGIADEVFSPRP